MAKQLTLRQAQQHCRTLGIVLSKSDGEYRVNFKLGDEATAYYTNDLHDAMRTALAMVRRITVALQKAAS